MKTIWLMRHAKSSWKDSSLPDHERPLAPRGRRAAATMGRHLAEGGIRPALVLCSSALRARETLELLEPALADVAVWTEDGLYGASGADLLRRLRQLPETAPSVLLIGHNPGLQGIAVGLAGGGDPVALGRLRAKLPTAGLATLSASVRRWKDLEREGAELTAFVVPRELA
jgi:phosphohistidine phosphatase